MSTNMASRILMKTLRLIKALLISVIITGSTLFGWQLVISSSPRIPVDKETPQRLEETVRILSERIGPRNYAYYENLGQAAQYIQESFRSLGYSVEEWPYQAGGHEFKNLVARITKTDTHEYIVIGAHYDSCFNPGADDNASGVAGLLELARLLRQESINANILFVAFVNEEPPFFLTEKMGSKIFVKRLQAEGIKVKMAVILEMIGFYSDKWFSQKYLPLLGPFYPNKGNFIAVVGDFNSSRTVNFIHKDFERHNYFPMESIVAPQSIPGINFSDHASFWEAGLPAVMVTDTAYLRNPNYHKKADTADTLDFEKMARVVAGLKESIVKLANK